MALVLGPAYWDAEVDALTRLLNRGMWSAHETAVIERAIKDRAEQVQAGVGNPTAVIWTEKIKKVDERLRMRWDFKNGYTIDRWAQGCWQVVGVLGFNHVMINLVDYLRERDMQRWPTPEAYLAYKREQAMKVQIANEYKANQQLQTVIDKMSDKQVKEFITVEAALQSGETVRVHGESARMLRRLIKGAKNAQLAPSHSINPGHRPFKHSHMMRNAKKQNIRR